MDRDEFVKKAVENIRLSDNDKLLVAYMEKILMYFRSIKERVNTKSATSKFGIGAQHPHYPIVEITYLDNILRFTRNETTISVVFQSNKDTEYSKKYKPFIVDSLELEGEKLNSKENNQEFSDDLLDTYLPYLLV